MRIEFRNLVWLAIAICLTLAVYTSLGSRSAPSTPFAERRPLNTHDESNTPGNIRCRAIAGPANWDSAATARFRTIMRDSSSESARAAAVEAAFPDVVTFDALETRACTLLRHGVSDQMYVSFVDSVVPHVLAAQSSASVTDNAPSLILPAEGRRFDFYPRKTTVAWHSVPGADHYLLEFQVLIPVQWRSLTGELLSEGKYWLPHSDGLHEADVRDTVATFFFVGGQPGRWRVRAEFADGRTTPPSEWRTFEYSR